jgi:hypothetical protein
MACAEMCTTSTGFVGSAFWRDSVVVFPVPRVRFLLLQCSVGKNGANFKQFSSLMVPYDNFTLLHVIIVFFIVLATV